MSVPTYQVKPRTRWLHVQTGNIYEVDELITFQCALEALDKQPTVVYCRVIGDRPQRATRYGRLLAEFCDGRFQPWRAR